MHIEPEHKPNYQQCFYHMLCSLLEITLTWLGISKTIIREVSPSSQESNQAVLYPQAAAVKCKRQAELSSHLGNKFKG